MGERGRLGSTEVMDAEAVSSEGRPQTQRPVVLYKHTRTLSLLKHKVHRPCLKLSEILTLLAITACRENQLLGLLTHQF